MYNSVIKFCPKDKISLFARNLLPTTASLVWKIILKKKKE